MQGCDEGKDASRQGRAFLVGNGERVPNEGETTINFRAFNERGLPVDFASTFQSAKVTKPLMSVSKVCANGHTCKFTDQQALILDSAGHTVCTFKRQKGLYVSRMRLRAPTPFGGQA